MLQLGQGLFFPLEFVPFKLIKLPLVGRNRLLFGASDSGYLCLSRLFRENFGLGDVLSRENGIPHTVYFASQRVVSPLGVSGSQLWSICSQQGSIFPFFAGSALVPVVAGTHSSTSFLVVLSFYNDSSVCFLCAHSPHTYLLGGPYLSDYSLLRDVTRSMDLEALKSQWVPFWDLYSLFKVFNLENFVFLSVSDVCVQRQ